MTQVKKLDFSGTTIYCGVDVHKKSWRVNIQDSEFELEDFTQNPQAVLLHKHLIRHYPGATYKIGYEAGFSMHRSLSQLGCQCWVVNAADIPSSDKDKKQKYYKADARKLCNYLQSKKLKGIYILDQTWEHARTLVRTRERIVNNQTRCKNRIWQLLHFSGSLSTRYSRQRGNKTHQRHYPQAQPLSANGTGGK
jgi:transposase